MRDGWLVNDAMKTIPTLLAATFLSASAVFAQSATELAQMRVNMYSPTGRMMQERDAIIAAPLSGSGTSASSASLEAQQKIIKLLEDQNITLSSQYLLMQQQNRR